MRMTRYTLAAMAASILLPAFTVASQSAGRWLTQPNFTPAPAPANDMAVVDYRGKVYVFGGATVESQPNALKSWEYDPVADTWKDLAPMPSKRTASVAVESGGKIYVIGGSDEGGLSVATN